MKEPTAEIISSGEEILQGLYADTNAQQISLRLKRLGIRVLFHTAVGDNTEAVRNVLTAAKTRTDIVLVTGGLGPTVDDVNRSVIASVYECPLEYDQKAAEMIRAHFKARRIPMPEGNLVQAQLPAGSIPLYNGTGTAPGFIIHNPDARKALIAMPGPPREWMPMFDGPVTEFLRTYFPTETVIKTLVLRTINVPESRLNEQIKPLFGTIPGVSLALLAKPGKVDIRATASTTSEKEADRILADARSKILSRIDSSCVYGETQDATIEGAVARLLTQQGKIVAAAESCTGGLLTKRLTDIPGSSAYIKECIVTYSNEAKMKYLGVHSETLKKYGAVSGEVAAEMASGIRHKSSADFGIGITGIAGPTGGSPRKPVGLVYFGLAGAEYIETWQRHFTGERALIRERAVDFTLDILRRALMKK